MTFTINGLEVEINAKGIHDDKNNKVDLAYFLNDIVLWSSDSAKWNERIGYGGIATEAENVASEVYKQMRESGLHSLV